MQQSRIPLLSETLKRISDFANRIQQNPNPSDNCSVELVEADLWNRFHSLGTEMIITKLGRRMFPGIRVQLKGLDPSTCYLVFLDMIAVDFHRYTYSNGNWRVANANDCHFLSQRVYIHQDSPNFGGFWMENSVSFAKAKLTNNTEDTNGNLILTSMHKYIPRVTLVGFRLENGRLVHEVKHFSFSETEFIAVTAYQSEMITDLKIRLNPFARGFRRRRLSKLIDTNRSNGGEDDNNCEITSMNSIAKGVARSRSASAGAEDSIVQSELKRRKIDYGNINSLID